jgi:hypothetical protein
LLFLLFCEGISGYKLYADEVSYRYTDSCFQFRLALVLNVKQSLAPALLVSTLLPSLASHFILILRVSFLPCWILQLSGCLEEGIRESYVSHGIKFNPSLSLLMGEYL